MVKGVCPLPGAGQNRPLPFLLPPHTQIVDDLLAPHGEVAKVLTMVKLATHKLLVLMLLLVLNFLPQPFQKNIWPMCCQIVCWLGVGNDSKALSHTLQGLTLSLSCAALVSHTYLIQQHH